MSEFATQLAKRSAEVGEAYGDINQLERLFFEACRDYAFLSDEMVTSLRNAQSKKKEIKRLQLNSMAEFNREYEMSEEYLIIKSCSYQLEGFAKLLWGVKVRIESLKAELTGLR